MQGGLRVGVAIGSGGIRPVAAIPVLAALERRGLAPAALAGCSGGAVIAALAAAGHPAGEARSIVERLLRRELFARVDPRGLLALLGRPAAGRPGLLRPDAILRMYRSVFGRRRIEDLPLPLALQATDLDSGEGVAMTRGPLADALYASTAAHPLLPPVKLDGRWLGDGAFSQPLPLEALPPVDVRIAVVVSGPDPPLVRALGPRFPAPAPPEGRDVTLIRIEAARSVRWWDVHLLPELFAAGERAADAFERALLADRSAERAAA